MFIVAGPPVAGKSTAFPVSGFGVDFFNADDRAAALNDGSYLNIPRNVRSHVNTLFESFVLDHISRRSSCAFETTLRSGITFDQTARACEAGFVIEMRYVALRDFSMHVERVKMRADAGGHSAPESVLRTIYLCGEHQELGAGDSGDGFCARLRQQHLGPHAVSVAAGRERRSCLLGRRYPGLAGDSARVALGAGVRPVNARKTSVRRWAIVCCSEAARLQTGVTKPWLWGTPTHC